LRSPIFNFSSSDLAEIRLVNKSVSFYAALRTYAKKDTDLAARCRDFLAQLQDLRDFSLSHRISELLWTIYERTSFLEIATAMTNGQQRRLNLTALYERASAYESSGFKDLYQFINFIARMRKNQKDLAQPILSENASNSVKLMTIHASKGLEFPVVFVLGLEHRYNYQQDITGSYVLDASGLGLSFAYPFDEAEYRADTLANAWLKIAKKQKLLEEEARLLYVALTRAKQKLILAANIKLPARTDLAGLEEKWAKEISAGRLPLLDKMKVAKPLDFLAPALARAKQVKRLGEKAVSDLATGQEGSLVFVHFDPKKDQAQLPDSEAVAASGADLTEDEAAVFKQAEKLYAFSQGGYPYLDASRTTAYQAVSEIKKVFGDPIEDELADSHISELQSANRYLQPIDAEPDFLFQNTVSSAELGTASHLVLQYYDYAKGDKDAIDSCIAGLVEKGRLSQTLASKLDREALSWFVKSDFAKDFYQQPDRLHREENFATILSPKTLFKDFSDFPGEILVHGTIDGYYEAENGIILFDYKTDHVNPRKQEEAIQKLKEKYQGQLRLYERALNESGRLPVLKKYLVLLSCREIVEVD
jgi:ATP-dependent helicase/nuclease subunit A